jgi:hypothetical protein
MAQKDNAEIGYKVAVDLLGILVESSWSRFNAMVLANSIIISVLGLILTNYNNKILLIFAVILSLMGILLAIFWFSLMARDSEFQIFYSTCARSFERRLSQGAKNETSTASQPIEIQTLLNGAKLAHEWPIKYPDEPISRDVYDDDKNNLQMKGLSKWKTRDNINHIIYLFASTYALIIILAVLLYLGP